MKLTDKQQAGLGLLALLVIVILIARSKNSSFKHWSSLVPPPPPAPPAPASSNPVIIYGGSPYPYGYPYGYQPAYPSGWGGGGLLDPVSIAYEDLMLQKLKPKVCKCGQDKEGRNITCKGKTDASGKIDCSCCGGETKKKGWL